VVKRKIPNPAGNRTQIVQAVAQRYTDWAIWLTHTHTHTHMNIYFLEFTGKYQIVTEPFLKQYK
jgi:hypothetical protein